MTIKSFLVSLAVAIGLWASVAAAQDGLLLLKVGGQAAGGCTGSFILQGDGTSYIFQGDGSSKIKTGASC